MNADSSRGFKDILKENREKTLEEKDGSSA